MASPLQSFGGAREDKTAVPLLIRSVVVSTFKLSEAGVWTLGVLGGVTLSLVT